MEKTLREVCDELGVSRRAVQGYEKAGLVSATDKTNRGYLLYDEEAQEKIRRIKMYQDVEFSLKEIAQLLDASADADRGALAEVLCNELGVVLPSGDVEEIGLGLLLRVTGRITTVHGDAQRANCNTGLGLLELGIGNKSAGEDDLVKVERHHEPP